MTDMQLRMLELRWRETGAVEDEVAYLQERGRQGLTTRKGIELAALLGHPASIAILGDASPEIVADPFFDVMGARKLPWDDPQFGVRVALAPARLLVGAWEERWPGSKRARKAVQEAIELCRSMDKGRAADRLRRTQAWKAEKDKQPVTDTQRSQIRIALIEALEVACQFVLGETPTPVQAAQRAFWVLGKDVVVSTLRRELVNWALGISDPLA